MTTAAKKVLRKALPKRGGFLDQVGVITGLWPEEGGFEQTVIPDSMGTAIALDLVGMHGQNFGHGQGPAPVFGPVQGGDGRGPAGDQVHATRPRRSAQAGAQVGPGHPPERAAAQIEACTD